MNAKTRTVMTVVSVMLILGLFALEQSTSAQSPISNCKKLKGTSVQVFDPVTGIVSGTVTNAGILDGTLEDVINSDAGFVLAPDPNVVTFLSDLTITTVNGQLKASPLTAFNFVTGFWSEFGNINPNTSTGRFAGATGVIFFSGKSIGNIDTGPFKAQITGEICFANEQ